MNYSLYRDKSCPQPVTLTERISTKHQISRQLLTSSNLNDLCVSTVYECDTCTLHYPLDDDTRKDIQSITSLKLYVIVRLNLDEFMINYTPDNHLEPNKVNLVGVFKFFSISGAFRYTQSAASMLSHAL